MLYELHELQKTITAPLVAWADANQRLFSNPYSPFAYHPLSRTIAASQEVLARLMRSYEKPAWGIDHAVVGGTEMPVSIEPVLKKPFCVLQHFRKEMDNPGPQGADLRAAVRPPRHAAARHRARGAAGLRRLHHRLGRCAPGAAGRRPVPSRRLCRLLQGVHPPARRSGLGPARDLGLSADGAGAGGGVAAGAGEGSGAAEDHGDDGRPDRHRAAIRPWSTSSPWAARMPGSRTRSSIACRTTIPGFMRRVYPGFLQHLGFVAMNADRHIDAHRKFFNHLIVGDGDSADAHRRFYDEYNAVLDMPAEYYLDTIKVVFQEFALAKGNMTVRGEPVRPEAIKSAALLTVEGELDDISGNGQTEAAHVLCRSIPSEKRKHLLAKGVGHYGIFSGRKFREQIYPQIRDFIRRWK